MKNIHVLPTNKPSKLATHYEKMRLIQTPDMWTYEFTKQNIYITSDEDIKYGDWVYNTNINIVLKAKNSGKGGERNWYKIILTTDQDLIKDGVQAIDDEFLEWFVKNPSCERVEVEVKRNKWLEFEEKKSFVYKCKIIIPSKDDLKIGDNTNFGIITDINEKSVCFGKNKVGVDVWYEKSYVVKFPNLVLEEPKQKTLTNDTDSHSWGFENFEIIKTEEDAKIFVETMENIPEPNDKLKKVFRDFNKQETLEEVSERFSKQFLNNGDNSEFEAQAALLGVKFGAKWQQERMYSEEEVFKLLKEFNKQTLQLQKLKLGNNFNVKEWFEQFKKK